jgi:hypothetical protein
MVRRRSPGGPQKVSEEKALQKLHQILKRMKSTPMYVLKLPLLVGLQLKVRELVVSKTSCPIIIILENALNWCTEKCGYGNFNHQYNVFPSYRVSNYV